MKNLVFCIFTIFFSIVFTTWNVNGQSAQNKIDEYELEEVIDRFIHLVLGSKYLNSTEKGTVIKWNSPIRIVFAGDWDEKFDELMDIHLRKMSKVTGVEITKKKNMNYNFFVFLFNKKNFINYLDVLKSKNLISNYFYNMEKKKFLSIEESGEYSCAVEIHTKEQKYINTAVIIVPGFIGNKKVEKCLVSQTARAFGVLNNLLDGDDTIFSDNSDRVKLSKADWIYLSVLYDSRIQAGMREAELRMRARSVLEGVLKGSGGSEEE